MKMSLDVLQRQQLREWADEAIDESGEEQAELLLPAVWIMALLDALDETLDRS